jgi:energy-coupling factor transport system ATP-binding protein
MAKLINVLEMPQSGAVFVMGRNTSDDSAFWQIRRSCGMVFQNPDNQIVGTTVEEDVAFGPENLGIPTAEIRKRVDESLQYVGLSDLARRQPSQLSGGQKQKLAIAGILAMQPQILLLDESTSMLDPVSRDEFLAVVDRLVKEKHLTVLHITHDMSEACLADYVFILDHGKLAMEGTPGEVFSYVHKIRALGLDVPVFAELAFEVSERLGISIDRQTLYSRASALAGIRKMLTGAFSADTESTESTVAAAMPDFSEDVKQGTPARIILKVSHLCHSYDKKDAPSLSDVSFSVNEGEIFAIIGQSGSGKTTLISHLNGLLRPKEGDIIIYPKGDSVQLNTRKNADVRQIRRTVGLLFQYPEYQLFEETVEKDIAFGPSKMGLSEQEIKRRVCESIALAGLDETFLTRSPFELSGGQKRRVAFAGVLAMDPDILVLDEPAAGLDPTGRRDILEYTEILKKRGKTIILVSHNMDEAAQYADRILVLKKGKVCALMTPQELFAGTTNLKELEISAPETVACLTELKTDYPSINPCFFRVSEAADELIRAASGNGDSHPEAVV